MNRGAAVERLFGKFNDQPKPPGRFMCLARPAKWASRFHSCFVVLIYPFVGISGLWERGTPYLASGRCLECFGCLTFGDCTLSETSGTRVFYNGVHGIDKIARFHRNAPRIIMRFSFFLVFCSPATLFIPALSQIRSNGSFNLKFTRTAAFTTAYGSKPGRVGIVRASSATTCITKGFCVVIHSR